MSRTGFTPEQVADVIFHGLDRCALDGILKGCTHRATTANHRLNRGMGGTSLASTNSRANASPTCWHCNDAIERDSEAQAEAIRRGVKLVTGDDPAAVPMWSVVYRQMVQPLPDALVLLGLPYTPREVSLCPGS